MDPISSELAIDEITLAAARRGDLRACERLYRQFERPAFTVALRLVRCRQRAQDVLQEAFITAFRRLDQFRGEAPFWGWLRAVVVNHALSALRQQPRNEWLALEDHEPAGLGDQPAMELAMDLESALEQLADADRIVVWLHDVEGYRHQEIADLFGMTESFSKTRLNRARQRLRELLGPELASQRAHGGTAVEPLVEAGLG